jgi:hypothetical protein
MFLFLADLYGRGNALSRCNDRHSSFLPFRLQIILELGRYTLDG